jgi:cytochrome c oxidase subunit 2
MFAEIIWFPHDASTTARLIDWLLVFMVIVCGSVGLMVAVPLIGFAIRYRRRPGDRPPPAIEGNVPLELVWTMTPMGIFLIMFGWGAYVYFNAYRAPDDATPIYVVGKQWMWKVQHPEGQREINELHVPTGQPVKLLLTSEDVIHSFFVPDFRVHMDVLPNRYTSVWFNATRPGRYHLFCSQYCGTNHAGMIGTVIVMEPVEYQRWLEEHAEGSLALEGRKTFLRYRCISCHSADPLARAPVLEGLYGTRVALSDGRTVLADDDYVREHILDPGKKVVAGWQNFMPTFRAQVSEEEIIALIAFIKGLKKGETPRRVEESPAPGGTPPIKPLTPQPPLPKGERGSKGAPGSAGNERKEKR